MYVAVGGKRDQVNPSPWNVFQEEKYEVEESGEGGPSSSFLF